MNTRNVALIYVRVSRLDEEERARKISPEMQRDKALALREVAGLTLVEFEDLDISGKSTENRPGYRAMMERLEAGDVRYIVAYDQSRITRNVGDLQRFREALTRHGALFIEASTGRTLDPEDEDQELGSNVIGSVDQHYRRKLARRVRDALAAKVQRGELVGPVPAGYVRRREILPSGKIARTWVEVDEQSAPTIRTIFADYATGAYSLKSLARSLKDRGVPLPRRSDFRNGRGKRPDGSPERAEIFTADVLKDLLTNPRYVGRVPARDGRVFAGAFPALIDPATWADCERVRIRARSSKLVVVRRAGSRYFLSGILRCPRCGSTMSGQTWKAEGRHRAARYRYTCYRRRVSADCDAPYVSQDWVEASLLEILRAVALPEGFARSVDAAAATYMRGASGPRKSSARALETRLARLRDLYELGDIELEEYVRRRDALETERAALKATRPSEPTFARQRETVRSLVDEWDEMTIDERREFVGVIFVQIRADTETGKVQALPREPWKRYVRAVASCGTDLSGRRDSNPQQVPAERR